MRIDEKVLDAIERLSIVYERVARDPRLSDYALSDVRDQINKLSKHVAHEPAAIDAEFPEVAPRSVL